MTFGTAGPGFYRLGGELHRRLNEMGAENGLLTVFCAHTSASLCIQENADPSVLADLGDALKRLAPEDARYRHHSEGPDDMPAHIKTLLTATSLSLPVRVARKRPGSSARSSAARAPECPFAASCSRRERRGNNRELGHRQKPVKKNEQNHDNDLKRNHLPSPLGKQTSAKAYGPHEALSNHFALETFEGQVRPDFSRRKAR